MIKNKSEILNYWRGGRASLEFLGGAPFVMARIARTQQEMAHARKLLGDHFARFLDTCRISVVVEGALPEPGKGCVISHNESSFADLAAYFIGVWPWVDRVAGADLYRHIPFARAACRKMNLDLISRGNRRATDPLVDSMALTVQQGGRVGWGAEGRLSGIDGIAPIKVGGSIIAIKAKAPVVPVVIHGGHHAMPLGTFRARPTEITVRYCEPVQTTDYTEKDARLLAEEMRKVLVRNYDELSDRSRSI